MSSIASRFAVRDSVIVSAVRTPTGKFLGALKSFTAPQLGALVVAEAIRRAGVDADTIDECIMGNVVSAGLGQNPARQAALKGGLPDHVAAVTINKVCGSGLKAVMLADQGIRAGDIDIAVAAVVDRDESIRAETTADTLGALKPAFKKDGTVTAGNAPGVNDGASALVVMAAERAHSLGLAPLVRVIAQATSGLAPKFVLMTPVEAVRRVAEKAGWDLKDVDLFELNEAFAVQAVAVLNELGIDRARVNVNGGAVALGHAIGSSGSRVLTTLLYALTRRHLKRGIATLCLGGGNGVALAVERM